VLYREVSSVSFSPDGKQVASGSYDKSVKIWETSTGTCVSTLTGHSSAVRAVTWNPDGSMLASGSEDNTIKLWDAQSGKVNSTLIGHRYDSPNCTCTFDEDGDLEEVNLRCPVSGHSDW
jgi:WD40 repeat protein